MSGIITEMTLKCMDTRICEVQRDKNRLPIQRESAVFLCEHTGMFRQQAAPEFRAAGGKLGGRRKSRGVVEPM